MASSPQEKPGTAAPPPPSYPARRRNGAGTAALVIGVVSLVLAILVVFSPLSLLLGIIAVIFGGVGMSRASRGEADNRSHAIAGLVTGLLSIIIVIAIGISFANFIADHQSDLRRFGTCMTSADNDEERASCVRRLGDALEEND